jgi:putative ABC transport system substrate-binding protein
MTPKFAHENAAQAMRAGKFDFMNRRDVIAGLGAAAAWPLAARAQGSQPVIGYLGSGTARTFGFHVKGFLNGLKESGFVDGQNVRIEYRWADGQFGRLPALAEELVQKRVDLLATTGGTVSAIAAKRATASIPIAFLTADDPVASGLVASMSRPGGNITGVTWLGAELGAKGLELLRELLPSATEIGMLVNPGRPTTEVQLKYLQDAAKAVGRVMRTLPVRTAGDIEATFKTIKSERIAALLVASDPLFIINREQLLRLAASHAVPTVYFQRDFADSGGLMSYGASLEDASKLCGDYAGRILKGAKPADLPIQQSTKVELLINLKTAKALGLTFPLTLLGRADEVIE